MDGIALDSTANEKLAAAQGSLHRPNTRISTRNALFLALQPIGSMRLGSHLHGVHQHLSSLFLELSVFFTLGVDSLPDREGLTAGPEVFEETRVDVTGQMIGFIAMQRLKSVGHALSSSSNTSRTDTIFICDANEPYPRAIFHGKSFPSLRHWLYLPNTLDLFGERWYSHATSQEFSRRPRRHRFKG